jgi:hypothetical protein
MRTTVVEGPDARFCNRTPFPVRTTPLTGMVHRIGQSDSAQAIDSGHHGEVNCCFAPNSSQHSDRDRIITFHFDQIRAMFGSVRFPAPTTPRSSAARIRIAL